MRAAKSWTPNRPTGPASPRPSIWFSKARKLAWSSGHARRQFAHRKSSHRSPSCKLSTAFGCASGCSSPAAAPPPSSIDELAFHLERQIAENRAAGMSSGASPHRRAAPLRQSRPAARPGPRHLELVRRRVAAARPALLRAHTAPHAGLHHRRHPGDGARHRRQRGPLHRGPRRAPPPAPVPGSEPPDDALRERLQNDAIDYNVVAGGVYAEWKKHNQ